MYVYALQAPAPSLRPGRCSSIVIRSLETNIYHPLKYLLNFWALGLRHPAARCSTTVIKSLERNSQPRAFNPPGVSACPPKYFAKLSLCHCRSLSTYLNFDSVKPLALSPRITLFILPFAEYASCYFGFHATKKLTQSVKYLAQALLVQYPSHVCASIFLSARDCWTWWIEHSSDGFTRLHSTASLSIHKLVNCLIERGAIGID